MNTWRNRHTILTWAFLTKSTHDLGKIDIRSRVGRTDQPVPNELPTQLQLISNDHTRFKLSLLSPQVTLSKLQYHHPNGMHYTCIPNTPPKRINTIWADQRTCLQLSNWMEHHFKWPQEEPNMSQHWLSNWLALQSKCFQDDPTKSE